ncbi:hypothetical protein DFJ73DRAFT_778451 [Zopfochytrium polystomum]|nr:hypothetical protein DFJ73DRAFT_778451 [Zopfochytrium polystomum]
MGSSIVAPAIPLISKGWRDVFKPEEIRIALIIFALTPSLGPVLCPIIGSFLVERDDWQWTFHALSMIGAVVILSPRLLAVKAAKTGKNPPSSLHGSISQVLGESLKRPFILLFTQPIVQVVALYMADVYGLLYLLSLGLGLFIGCIGSVPFMQKLKIYLLLREKNNGIAEPEFPSLSFRDGGLDVGANVAVNDQNKLASSRL